jgi:hypothetical protein
MEMTESDATQDAYHFEDYDKHLEDIGKYLWILESITTDAKIYSFVKTLRNDLFALMSLLHVATVKVSVLSLDVVLNIQLACLNLLDGIPDATDVEMVHVSCGEEVDDLRNAIGQIARHRAALNRRSQTSTLQKQLVTSDARSAFGSDASEGLTIADQIKLQQLSIELVRSVSEETPLVNIETRYTRVADDLRKQADKAQKKLSMIADALRDQSLGQDDRGPAWQKGIGRLLIG